MAEPVAASEVPRKAASHAEPPPLPGARGQGRRRGGWIVENGPWWLCSFVFHLILLISLALLGTMGTRAAQQITGEAPAFKEADLAQAADVPLEIERFEVGQTPEEPTELNTDTLGLEKPARIAQEAESYDDSPVFEHRGGGLASAAKGSTSVGLGGFDISGIGAGPAVKGRGGVGVGVGAGVHPGSGGEGWGFGGRGSGSRKALLASGGGTKQSERAVAAALELARTPSTPQRRLGPGKLQEPLQGRHVQRPRQGRRTSRRRHRLGLVAVPGRRPNPRIPRPLQKDHRRRDQVPDRQPAAGRRPVRGRRHVRPRSGRHRPVGVLRHDRRQNLRAAAQSALNFIMEAQDPKRRRLAL